VVSLVADSVEVILPIIYGVLFHNAYHHWNRSIRSLSLGSLQLFQEIDSGFYGKVVKQYKEDQEKSATRKPTPSAPTAKTLQDNRTLYTANNKAIAPPDVKPQEGPPIRRKSLLPVDPSTLAALTVHKSLDDIVTPGDDYEDLSQSSSESDSEHGEDDGSDAAMEDDISPDEPRSISSAPPPATSSNELLLNSDGTMMSDGDLPHKMRST
jgi:serine/threonine-protein phosphatase 2A regulatory subunit B'